MKQETRNKIKSAIIKALDDIIMLGMIIVLSVLFLIVSFIGLVFVLHALYFMSIHWILGIVCLFVILFIFFFSIHYIS